MMRSRGASSNGQLRLMLSDFRKKLARLNPGVFAGPFDTAVAAKDRDLAERFVDCDCHSLARLEFLRNGPETSELLSFESHLRLFGQYNLYFLLSALHFLLLPFIALSEAQKLNRLHRGIRIGRSQGNKLRKCGIFDLSARHPTRTRPGPSWGLFLGRLAAEPHKKQFAMVSAKGWDWGEKEKEGK